MTEEFIKKVLIGAGKILIEGFNSTKTIQSKQDQSNVVTDSDFKSEEYIRSEIISAYPSHAILGEEHGFEDKQSRYTWVIDPLDGTSNFACPNSLVWDFNCTPKGQFSHNFRCLFANE